MGVFIFWLGGGSGEKCECMKKYHKATMHEHIKIAQQQKVQQPTAMNRIN